MNYQDLVTIENNTPLTTSHKIAEALGIKHRSLMQLIKDHKIQIEKHFGKICFENAPSGKTNQKQGFAILTENQANYVLMLSDNTEKSMEVKALFVKAFAEAKEELAKAQKEKQSQQERTRIYPWTEEAEQLRQINMKEIQPGYWSSSAFVLQKLIYINLGDMIPDERAKIDISFGKFFPRWLKGDQTGQLKNCCICPEHCYSKSHVLDIGHVVDTKTGDVYPVKHYANLYSGDRDNFWELWYAPVILPVYFNGKLPDGLPRMQFGNDLQ